MLWKDARGTYSYQERGASCNTKLLLGGHLGTYSYYGAGQTVHFGINLSGRSQRGPTPIKERGGAVRLDIAFNGRTHWGPTTIKEEGKLCKSRQNF